MKKAALLIVTVAAVISLSGCAGRENENPERVVVLAPGKRYCLKKLAK